MPRNESTKRKKKKNCRAIEIEIISRIVAMQRYAIIYIQYTYIHTYASEADLESFADQRVAAKVSDFPLRSPRMRR